MAEAALGMEVTEEETRIRILLDTVEVQVVTVQLQVGMVPHPSVATVVTINIPRVVAAVAPHMPTITRLAVAVVAQGILAPRPTAVAPLTIPDPDPSKVLVYSCAPTFSVAAV